MWVFLQEWNKLEEQWTQIKEHGYDHKLQKFFLLEEVFFKGSEQTDDEDQGLPSIPNRSQEKRGAISSSVS